MPAPTSFKAAVVPEPGAQHKVVDRSPPQLKDDEVLIRNTATAINPVDWKARDYKLFISDYPAVLGSDAAGEIAAVGSAVNNVKEGDRVFYQGILGNNASSTFQQYTVLPAALVGLTPNNVTDDEAAGISLATVAALVGLYDKSGHALPKAPWDQGGDQVGKGKAIVVLGGSSSVGQYAIQLARLSGFERIITNSSASHFDHLKQLGATDVLDRSTATADDFVKAAGSAKLDVVYDGISAKETQALAIDILAPVGGGNVVLVLQPDQDNVKAGKEKKVEFRPIMGLGSSPALRYLSEPLMKNLGGEQGYLATGKFRANRATVVPGGLEHIEDALAKNKQGVSGVKVVIRPFDS
ncbi:uncharacterized protein PFL1_02093 [Pseudozyma flocculosa PF-1]|uniref:Related to Zinc-binding oxidoreductase n=1 Tax=Pseudozyma flocculosa TaxID=84751 RepID=A0A5C3F311_9BASI|nr:uncharacterized protein PFL1_02093 [Pseudozyma flocculosa PF-1]EPQ30569.1 hypothetical protein PFL1_02093 [Pseudozyma flocculosa PF-1]SPO37661.1 related to Zinc-binding oxidoreductase [Pseudozyma flocculosa]